MNDAGTVVAAIDLSEISEAVLDVAITYARMSSRRLYILHVGAPEPDFVPFHPGEIERDWMARELRDEHRQLHAFRQRAADAGLDAEALMIQGMTAEKLAEQAGKLSAALIVMGTHRHGALHHLLAGSILTDLLRLTPCPLLVVPPPAADREPA